MSGQMLTISDLLRDAADALEEAYKGREDIPPASLALILACGSVSSTSRPEIPSWKSQNRRRQPLLKTNRSPAAPVDIRQLAANLRLSRHVRPTLSYEEDYVEARDPKCEVGISLPLTRLWQGKITFTRLNRASGIASCSTASEFSAKEE
jgi:hypothetical protein